jgi:hypothetical protein
MAILGLLEGEDECTMILQNAKNYTTNNIQSKSRRLESSKAPVQEPQTSHHTRVVPKVTSNNFL